MVQPPPPGPGQQLGSGPPAAPTQVVFPGQIGAPQQQYVPTPAQAASQGGTARAVGFPGYRSPAPSPKSQTSAVVGSAVVTVTVLFAVLGFVLVSGRAPSTPSAAALAYIDAAVDGDSGRVHDLLCERVQAQVPESAVETDLMGGNQVPDSVQAEVVSTTDTVAPDGRPAVDVVLALTVFGQTAQQDVVLVEEDGYRVCGGSLGFG
ncbi:hypothetical protein [Klenkia terrae]|uniref:DUF4878 domain-containing protein n=1 Tax=Klenkia terrae TaxID=1052259 RepID=A0ABU8E8F4_9ACTN|nr:hypothetical protein [Klenkia terrae]